MVIQIHYFRKCDDTQPTNIHGILLRLYNVPVRRIYIMIWICHSTGTLRYIRMSHNFQKRVICLQKKFRTLNKTKTKVRVNKIFIDIEATEEDNGDINVTDQLIKRAVQCFVHWKVLQIRR